VEEKDQNLIPLTRSEIIAKMRNRLAISTREASLIIDTFLECIAKTLEDKGLVVINGFGRFQVKETSKRVGRNPLNGEEFDIPAKMRPCFAPSKFLRKKLTANLEDS